MYRLSALFEEDIEMQDALEDIDNLVDDTEDILITSMEDRFAQEEESPHLFDDDEVNEDGLTEEEQLAISTALLDDEIEDEDFIEDDEVMND